LGEASGVPRPPVVAARGAASPGLRNSCGLPVEKSPLRRVNARICEAKTPACGLLCGQNEEVAVSDTNSGTRDQNGRHKVLIVDDEPLVRWSLSETLREAGYSILEAGDARSALRQANQSLEPFDAILLDLWLPDSNDLSVLGTLCQNVNAPIILMTAHGSRELTERALDLGAYAVLNKPFSMDDIVTVVAEARGERARRMTSAPNGVIS